MIDILLLTISAIIFYLLGSHHARLPVYTPVEKEKMKMLSEWFDECDDGENDAKQMAKFIRNIERKMP